MLIASSSVLHSVAIAELSGPVTAPGSSSGREVVRVAAEQGVREEEHETETAAADGEAGPPAHAAAVADLAGVELGAWVRTTWLGLLGARQVAVIVRSALPARHRGTALRCQRCIAPHE